MCAGTRTGQNTGMTTDETPTPPAENPTEPLPDDEPNLAPGPTDRGGHGGMATREAEARRAGDH